MSCIRVAHVITKLELGGAQGNTLYTVANLNRSLFDVHLIAGPGGMLDDEARELKDVTLHYCGDLSRAIRPIADFHAYNLLRKLLQDLKPDIVHTHSSKAGVLGRLAASAQHVPVIIHTYHGFGFHRYQNPGVFRLYVALEREACRRSHHLIFVSNENRKWAEELDLIQKCSVSLIRSGVEIEPLLQAKRSDAMRDQLGVSRNGKAVGMIACLKSQKDPLTFVEAADLSSRKISNARFFLFGDGELADAVARRARKMRNPHSFHHSGWIRNVPEVLANLDLVVLTSLWEGLPRVIPEATIAGVPVVASNIDGNREIIFEGRNGTLAEPRSPENFAEKITRALKEGWEVDPDLSRQIQHEFDIREMVRKQEALYLQLMKRTLPANVHADRVAE